MSYNNNTTVHSLDGDGQCYMVVLQKRATFEERRELRLLSLQVKNVQRA